jgi:dUTP pyrophosphatase
VELMVRCLHPDATLPKRAHPDDAGADVTSVEEVTLNPGERSLVSTGLAIAVPTGYVTLLHPRSGLALKHGLSIVNAPGTIDSGYRGEVKALLINLGQEPVQIKVGDRIAQLVVQKVELCPVVAVENIEDLGDSLRGSGGYGSTGTAS